VTTSTAHGFADGQKVFIAGTSTNADNYQLTSTGSINATTPAFWQINYVSSTTFTLVGSTYSSAASAGLVYASIFGDELEAYRTASSDIGIPSNGRQLAIEMSGFRYYGTIDGGSVGSAFYLGVYTAAHANWTVLNADSSLVSGTTATAWFLGKYSGVMPNNAGLINPSSTPAGGNGFPAAVALHQNRLSFAGCPNSPDDVDLSSSGLYENFSISPPTGSTALQPQDDSAINERLLASDLNPIMWLKSTAHGLVAGTFTAEFLITPDSNSAALTPSNFNSQMMTYYGVSHVDAITIDNAVIFVPRGQRKMRELLYNFFIGTYKPTDLTDASDHIGLPSITKIDVQVQRQPIVWAIRSDGTLLSMTYIRTDEPGFGTTAVESGWARHILGGQSDAAGTQPIVYSIAVIPDPTNTFDQLWLVVKRWINGETVYTIEYMTDIFSDDILQEDAFFGDCGATEYTAVSISAASTGTTTTITANNHGFSNGDQVKIVDVVGLNVIATGANGITTTKSLVNGQFFTVASKTTNTFEITDSDGNAIDSSNASAYVSGGEAAKLISSVSGLTWLENETVGVYIDGGYAGTVVVSNSGVITLPYPGAKIQIGYPFLSQGQLLRIEGGAQDGSSFGDLRRTQKYAIQLHRTGSMSIGTSFSNLIPCNFKSADYQNFDYATPLFDGIYKDSVQGEYDFESELCFQQNDMCPSMIQSIASKQEVNEE